MARREDAEVFGAREQAGELEEIRRVLLAAVRRHVPPSLAADTEDLVQEALLKVMASWKPVEGERRPTSSYLWRTAYTTIVDEIRRRQRRREDSLEARAPDEPCAREADPERRAASRRLGEAMTRCLRGLLEDRRRAVVLRLQGHRVAEVGELLGFGAKRAENLVYRALADLRECLRRKGFEP